MILRNSLEGKMKAAADIAEYEQAQSIKQAIEVHLSKLHKQIGL